MAQGVSPQGTRSRLAFVNASGVAALRAGPPAGAAFAELVPGPSRLSAPSLARPMLRSSEWKGCHYRRSGRRSGRIGFLKSVDDQIATQSAIHSDPTRRDDHCPRAYLGYVLAFICRLQGDEAPMGLNPLDAPQAIAAVASVGAVGPPAVSAKLATGAFPTAFAAAAARLLDHTAASRCARVRALGRTGISRRHGTSDGRRFPRGWHPPRWLAGGGAEGLDLTTSARRVLDAQQMLHGLQAAGPLLITPPPGKLPPASSYPPPLVGPPTAPPPYPSPAPHARTQGTPDGVQQPSPHSAAQRSKQLSGGAGSSSWPAEMLLALREQSDSLCTQYSPGLLGSFSPYRGVPFRPDLRYYECGALQQHYAAECPARLARVRGESPADDQFFPLIRLFRFPTF